MRGTNFTNKRCTAKKVPCMSTVSELGSVLCGGKKGVGNCHVRVVRAMFGSEARRVDGTCRATPRLESSVEGALKDTRGPMRGEDVVGRVIALGMRARRGSCWMGIVGCGVVGGKDGKLWRELCGFGWRPGLA